MGNYNTLMKSFFFAIILIALSSCTTSTKEEPIELKDLKFESTLGYNSLDTNSIYCLLKTGFFRAPSSKESDSLINSWITLHPKAKIISVSSFGPVMTDLPNSKMIYCWVVDKHDTLNNYLIKNGCYSRGTMLNPNKNDTDLPDQIYMAFKKQIKNAENYAKKKKLGIWSKKKDTNNK